MAPITGILKGVPINILDSVPSAPIEGESYALPSVSTLVEYQISYGTEPSAISLLIQLSHDGTTWVTEATITGTNPSINHFINSAMFIRAVIDSITDGDEITVNIVAKAYTVQNVTNNYSGDSGLRSISVEVIPEEVLTLFSSPKELIPAQGINTFIELISAVYNKRVFNIPYGDNSPDVTINLDETDVTESVSSFLNVINGKVGLFGIPGNVEDYSDYVNQPLNLAALSEDPTSLGGIDTSEISNGGSLYAIDDELLIVSEGNTITAVNQGTKTFTLSNAIPTYITKIVVTGSTGNDGYYTVDSINGFDVTVNEAIPNTTADGDLLFGTATITVDSVLNSYEIDSLLIPTPLAITTAAVDPVNNFVVAGDHVAEFPIGKKFTVTGSTGNDGTYTVTASVPLGPDTSIGVTPPFFDATADGSITLYPSVFISGDHSADFTATDNATIYRSTNNDTTATIFFVDFSGGLTELQLDATLASPADGFIGNDSTSNVGEIDTYTLNEPGIYGVGVYNLQSLVPTDTSSSGELIVSTLSSELSDGTIQIQLLYKVINIL